MLNSLLEILPSLETGNACLPAFDIAGGQPDFLFGALRACEAARCPALLLVWAPGATYIGLEACADLVKSAASRATVPVILHLDHCNDEATFEKCLRLGFRSVMFDGSALPFEENIRRTREMVALARSLNASIEGELGVIGSEHGEASADVTDSLTDPAQAERFVKETGVDLFAPAVGNAHGFYKKPPQLRFELIREIRSRTGVSLSLHGGTGLPFSDIRQAAGLGVRKLNVATAMHGEYTRRLLDTRPANPSNPFGWSEILGQGRDAIAEMAAGYIRELGAEGIA